MTTLAANMRLNGFKSAVRGVVMLTALAVIAPVLAHENDVAPIEALPMSSQMDRATIVMQPMIAMSMTGNVDYDFAANMRNHHQMAITMAQAQLSNGKDSDMRQMAEDIIEAQKEEVAMFDEWMKDNKVEMKDATSSSN